MEYHNEINSINPAFVMKVIEGIALQWIQDNMSGKEWPDDDWYALSDHLDINLWMWEDENGNPERRATVYPILSNGSTCVDSWFVRVSLEKFHAQA